MNPRPLHDTWRITVQVVGGTAAFHNQQNIAYNIQIYKGVQLYNNQAINDDLAARTYKIKLINCSHLLSNYLQQYCCVEQLLLLFLKISSLGIGSV